MKHQWLLLVWLLVTYALAGITDEPRCPPQRLHRRGTSATVAQNVSAASQATTPSAAVLAKIDATAKIRKSSFERTKLARNQRLNEIFRQYLAEQSEPADVGAAVRMFHAALKDRGFTTFEDFLAAETTPVRQVKDPLSGKSVPVMGALGSDVINPWLGAIEVVDGKPLEEQPIYSLGGHALEEHIDFALVGIADPNLSLDALPDLLRANARASYRRINPRNKFAGGFDHPLYYAVIRDAAKKLFRQDFPKAKITMAELVLPESKGGFGIKSCLLCHDQSHEGTYKRLLGQAMYQRAKAQTMPAGEPQKQAEAIATIFAAAAQTVLDSYPDKIDASAVRQALATVSATDVPRLKPGYADFHAVLKAVGCLRCHGGDGQPPDGKNPKDFGAFVLHTNAYYKAEDIAAILTNVDIDRPSESRLIRKTDGTLKHEGLANPELTGQQQKQLVKGLEVWLNSFR